MKTDEKVLDLIESLFRFSEETNEPALRYEWLCTARGALYALSRALEEEQDQLRGRQKEIEERLDQIGLRLKRIRQETDGLRRGLIHSQTEENGEVWHP